MALNWTQSCFADRSTAKCIHLKKAVVQTSTWIKEKHNHYYSHISVCNWPGRDRSAANWSHKSLTKKGTESSLRLYGLIFHSKILRRNTNIANDETLKFRVLNILCFCSEGQKYLSIDQMWNNEKHEPKETTRLMQSCCSGSHYWTGQDLKRPGIRCWIELSRFIGAGKDRSKDAVPKEQGCCFWDSSPVDGCWSK